MHNIVSFYKKNLNNEIISLQKKVFDKFNIPLLQIEFNDSHSCAIENYLKNNNWSSVSIIDIDLIPLKADVFKIAEQIINKNNIVYGNAQSSNSCAYVAPSFLNFSKKTFELVNQKSFCGGFYNEKEIDVAEKFSIVAAKKNINIVFSLPIKCILPKWECKAGLNKFKFGIGTYYDNNTYHNFEIRHNNYQSFFINECNRIINLNN